MLSGTTELSLWLRKSLLYEPHADVCVCVCDFHLDCFDSMSGIRAQLQQNLKIVKIPWPLARPIIAQSRLQQANWDANLIGEAVLASEISTNDHAQSTEANGWT